MEALLCEIGDPRADVQPGCAARSRRDVPVNKTTLETGVVSAEATTTRADGTRTTGDGNATRPTAKRPTSGCMDLKRGVSCGPHYASRLPASRGLPIEAQDFAGGVRSFA
jgi:hypothetical protein